MTASKDSQFTTCPNLSDNGRQTGSATGQDYSKIEQSVLFHLKTLWLFTKSDMKPMVYANIVFGCAGACSGLMSESECWHSAHDAVQKIAAMFAWLWTNLLVFCIANQRLKSSVVEDAVNKPWRPIPASRIAMVQARRLLTGLIPPVLLYSYTQGVFYHSLVLMVLTWIYNDLGGSDDHYLSRNLLNASGMAFYSGGALQIAVGKTNELTLNAVLWIGLVALVAFSTIQVQDLRDQAGDRLKGRTTLPLCMGDSFARTTMASAVFLWSIGAPSFWMPHIVAYFPSIILGSALAARLLICRDSRSDQRSWTLWSVWMVSIYLVPLLKISNV